MSRVFPNDDGGSSDSRDWHYRQGNSTSKLKTKTPFRKKMLWFFVVLLLTCVILIAIARIMFNGPALALKVKSAMNDSFSGRTEIRSITWPVTKMYKGITGGWLPVEIKGLRIHDDRHPILEVETITAEVDVHALMKGNYIARNVKVLEGGYLFVREVEIPKLIRDNKYDTLEYSILAAFDSYELKKSVRSGLYASSGPVFDIRDIEVKKLDIDIELRVEETQENPAYKLSIENAQSTGFVFADLRNPLRFDFFYSLVPSAEKATLHIPGVKPLEFANLKTNELHQLPLNWPKPTATADLRWDFAGTGVANSEVRIRGGMLDVDHHFFGGTYVMDLDVSNAGGLAEYLSHGRAKGKDLALNLHLGGPTVLYNLMVQMQKLDLSLPGFGNCDSIPAQVADLKLKMDYATNEATLDQAKIKVEKGVITLRSSIANPFDDELRRFHRLSVNTPSSSSIDLSRCVPREVTDAAKGSKLWGRANVKGTMSNLRLTEMDYHLGKSRFDGELALLQRNGQQRLAIKELSLLRGKNSVALAGDIGLSTQKLNLELKSIDVPNLGGVLKDFELPLVASSLQGTGTLTGSFDNPKLTSSAVASGIPLFDSVNIDSTYHNNKLVAQKITSSKGGLKGNLSYDLERGKLEKASIETTKLMLSDISSALSGTLTVAASLTGNVEKLDGTFSAITDGLTVAGDPVETFAVNGTLDKGNLFADANFSRSGGGDGQLELSRSSTGELTSSLEIRNFVLETFLSPASPSQSPLGGTLNASLDLNGTASDPNVSGQIALAKNWVLDGLLGNGKFAISSNNNIVTIKGTHSQARLEYDATVSLKDLMSSELRVEFSNLELDHISTLLFEEYGVRGKVSGEVTFRKDLLKNEAFSADVTINKLFLSYGDGVEKAVVRNITPLVAVYDGAQLVFQGPAQLETPSGVISVSGSANEQGPKFVLKGDIDVGIISNLLALEAGDISGKVSMNLTTAGTWNAPELQGDVSMDKIQLRHPGNGSVVTFGNAKVTFQDDRIQVDGLAVATSDRYSGRRSVFEANVGAQVNGLSITDWNVLGEGEISGEMLRAFFPNQVADAYGAILVEDIAIIDEASTLIVLGEIDLAPTVIPEAERLTVRPRGLRREVKVTQGRLKFDADRLCFDNIQASVDEESRIGIGKDGCEDEGAKQYSAIDLTNLMPESVDVTLWARDIPYRIPNVLDFTFNSDRINIVGELDDLHVGGSVQVRDAYFIQSLNVTEFITPSRIGSSDGSSIADNPIFANAKLGCSKREIDCDKLTLEVQSLQIKNNIADAELKSELIYVSGSIGDPRFDGAIEVTRGRFSLPSVRAKFTETGGNIRFSAARPLAEDNPRVEVQSTADYRDQTGKDHVITLKMSGGYPKIVLDYFTDTGLDKSQTISLMILGRTIDDLRQRFGDDSLPDNITSNTDSKDQDENPLDQLGKDLFGSYFGDRASGFLRNLTDIDIIRLSISTSSIEFYAEERWTTNLRLSGSWSQSAQQRRIRVKGSLILNQDFSIDAEYGIFSFESGEEDRTDRRISGLYRRLWR